MNELVIDQIHRGSAERCVINNLVRNTPQMRRKSRRLCQCVSLEREGEGERTVILDFDVLVFHLRHLHGVHGAAEVRVQLDVEQLCRKTNTQSSVPSRRRLSAALCVRL